MSAALHIPPRHDASEIWGRFRGSHYFVSSKARIWNARSRRMLTPHVNTSVRGSSYLRVTLCIEKGVKTHLYLHRMVAEVHVPGQADGLHVAHAPGDDPLAIESNFADRLRWLTPEENLAERGVDVDDEYFTAAGEPAPF